MSKISHLPDQPIMEYVHPTDRLRPWFGLAVGLAAGVGMLAFGILVRDFGTLAHLKAINAAGVWLTMSLIEASAGIAPAHLPRTPYARSSGKAPPRTLVDRSLQ